MINFSRVTSIYPLVLTKVFTKDSPNPKSSANVSSGIVKPVAVDDLIEFNDYINKLKKNQCLVYGIPVGLELNKEKEIILKGERKGLLETWPEVADDYRARSKDDFEFRSGEGILCLDYDADKKSFSIQDLRDIFIKVFPEFKNVPMLIRHSTSSFIKNIETGEFLRGERGKKIYIPVKDASVIKDIKDTLVGRLWLAGYGHIMVSNGGSCLVKTIIDLCMFQAERIDFCCGAVCEYPYEQQTPEPEFFNVECEYLDLAKIKPLSGKDKKKVENLISAAINEKKPEARKVGISYFREKGYDNPEKVYDSLQRHVLPLDFKLILSDGSVITVQDVIDNPDNYVGVTLHDPNEPDYNDNAQVAKILKDKDGKFFIKSFAHGGQIYNFSSGKIVIEYSKKNLMNIVRDVIDKLKMTNRIFYSPVGNELVIVEFKNKWITHSINKKNYGRLFGLIDELFEFAGVNDKHTTCIPSVLMNLIIDHCSDLNAFHGFSEFPVINNKLQWFNEVGYDEENGIIITDTLDINENPSDDDIREAFETIWKPVSLYTFKNAEISNSIIMSCFLNLVTLPLLETKPAVLFNAAKAGSGKTKLAEVFSTLFLGYANIGSLPSNDEELEKRIVSNLKDNNKIMIWDNIKEGCTLDSPYLCNNITGKNITCRLLGKSETIETKNDALHFFTGNNINPSGDMFRRVLNVYIDSNSSEPHKSKFPFCPVELVKEKRKEIISAIITVFNGFRNEGCKRVINSKAASFEMWDKYVRQCVFFLQTKLKDKIFDDPLESFELNNQDSDSENEKKQIFNGLYRVFKEKDFSPAMILNRIDLDDKVLCDVFNNEINSRNKAKEIGIKLKKLKDVMTRINIDDNEIEVKLEYLKDKHTDNKRWFKIYKKPNVNVRVFS